MALNKGVLAVSGLYLFRLLDSSEEVFFEQEVVCLISELLLNLLVKIVLVAVENEFLWITTLHITQITRDDWPIFYGRATWSEAD